MFLRDSETYWAIHENGYDEPNFHYVRELKCNSTPKQFCYGKRIEIFGDILEEAYSYEYEEEPNYGKLKFMLKSLLLNSGYIPDHLYSWIYLPG